MDLEERSVDIGFSGSQRLPTFAQQESLWWFLNQFESFVGHHGDCIGSDAVFDQLARRSKAFESMVIYPMAGGAKRAFCQPGPKDTVRPEAPPLVRNGHIAEACKFLVTTPKEDHMVLRSGTWSTVRRALDLGKEVVIICQNGAIVPWR